MKLSENELVTLLLCSDIAISDTKPLSDAAYSAFAQALFNENKQPCDLFSMSSDEILKIYNTYKNTLFSRCRINDFNIRIPLLLKRHQQLIIELSKYNNIGINVVTRANKQVYPQKLRKKFINAKIAIPPIIYYCGNIEEIDTSKTIAFVGSRNLQNDSKAEKFTNEFVASAVRENFSISSGGANGIDQLAFEAAVNNNGKSIITVSNSLLKKITEPTVRNEIMNGNTVFMSLVNPKARFTGYNAMARNKIIYAIADYSIVITCDYQTIQSHGTETIDNNRGGTWVGAHECVNKKLSRLMVRKSSTALRGNQELIKTVDCLAVDEEKFFDDPDINKIISGDIGYTVENSIKQGHQYELFSSI